MLNDRNAFHVASHSATIAQVAFADCAVGCAYTMLMIAALTYRETIWGAAMVHWIQTMDRGVEALLFFLPDPKLLAPSDLVDRVVAYRNTLVACAIISLACFLHSRRHWRAWTRDINLKMRTAGISPAARPEYILTAYRTAIIGVVATAFLLLLGEPRDDRVIDVLYGNDWTFFRAPLLLTLGGFFASHAAVLRRLLRPQ
jgi:hypothetical protein